MGVRLNARITTVGMEHPYLPKYDPEQPLPNKPQPKPQPKPKPKPEPERCGNCLIPEDPPRCRPYNDCDEPQKPKYYGVESSYGSLWKYDSLFNTDK